MLFSVRETPELILALCSCSRGFWTLNPSPTSLFQVAAVKFQGAGAYPELLAGVVEDSPTGLGSIKDVLCLLGTSRCNLSMQYCIFLSVLTCLSNSQTPTTQERQHLREVS